MPTCWHSSRAEDVGGLTSKLPTIPTETSNHASLVGVTGSFEV